MQHVSKIVAGKKETFIKHSLLVSESAIEHNLREEGVPAMRMYEMSEVRRAEVRVLGG